MPTSVTILGAGPSGAASALFLARRGHDVTILDRDPHPPPLPDQWNRVSVPHARQGHSFLALGTRVLSEEAPETVEALVAAGAQRVALRHDPRHWNLLVRRRLFDAVLRQSLLRASGIRVLQGVTATGLLIKRSLTADAPHVFGLKTAEGNIEADLVIDAGGWRSPVPRWLAAEQIEVKTIDDPTCFFYLTRHYRLRQGVPFPSVSVPIVAALGYATILAFPEDNGHFQLTVQLDLGDPSRHFLRDGTVFERFLAEVPLIAPWLEAGEPIGDPEPIASVGNRRKQLSFGKPLVTGLIMIGDAAVHTNPTAGRGVALALAHAQAISNLIDECANGSVDQVKLAADSERITSKLFDPWFNNQVQIDGERRIQIRSSLKGQSWSAASDVSGRLANALVALRDCDRVGAAGDRLFNLLSTPAEIQADRKVMRLLLQETRLRPAQPPRIGPSWPEYERLTRQR